MILSPPSNAPILAEPSDAQFETPRPSSAVGTSDTQFETPLLSPAAETVAAVAAAATNYDENDGVCYPGNKEVRKWNSATVAAAVAATAIDSSLDKTKFITSQMKVNSFRISQFEENLRNSLQQLEPIPTKLNGPNGIQWKENGSLPLSSPQKSQEKQPPLAHAEVSQFYFAAMNKYTRLSFCYQ